MMIMCEVDDGGGSGRGGREHDLPLPRFLMRRRLRRRRRRRRRRTKRERGDPTTSHHCWRRSRLRSQKGGKKKGEWQNQILRPANQNSLYFKILINTGTCTCHFCNCQVTTAQKKSFSLFPKKKVRFFLEKRFRIFLDTRAAGDYVCLPPPTLDLPLPLFFRSKNTPREGVSPPSTPLKPTPTVLRFIFRV